MILTYIMYSLAKHVQYYMQYLVFLSQKCRLDFFHFLLMGQLYLLPHLVKYRIVMALNSKRSNVTQCFQQHTLQLQQPHKRTFSFLVCRVDLRSSISCLWPCSSCSFIYNRNDIVLLITHTCVCVKCTHAHTNTETSSTVPPSPVNGMQTHAN